MRARRTPRGRRFTGPLGDRGPALARDSIDLRAMTEADLPLVAVWLREPHVARWRGEGLAVGAEIEKLRRRVTGDEPQSVRMLVVLEAAAPQDDQTATPIGWCQWYPINSDEILALGAEPGDCGFDYAIGDPAAIGRGLGTQLIAALVDEVRRRRPDVGIVVDPDAENRASRRVLEKNGFQRLALRPVATEPAQEPMAIYRLPGQYSPSPRA